MSNQACLQRLRLGLIGAVVLLAAAGAQAQADSTAVAPTAELSFGLDLDRASRSIVDPGTEFAAAGFSAETGQVYCLSRLSHMTAPTTVTHVWYHEGRTMARVELKVGGASWRTWSSKRILPAWTGQWEVKVLDADGMVLATAGFTIK